MSKKKKKINIKRIKSKPAKMLIYTPSEMNAIADFITKTYGPIEAIIHDSSKSKLHVDLCIIAPDDQRPYWKVITLGMGKYKMNAPTSSKDSDYSVSRCELVMAVEPFWDYSNLFPTDSHIKSPKIVSDLKQEYLYPIQVLKNIATIPILNKVFFDPPVTTELPGIELDVETKLDEFLLLQAQDVEPGKNVAYLPNRDPVAFYQVVPITHSERIAMSIPEKFIETINKINYIFWPERESTV